MLSHLCFEFCCSCCEITPIARPGVVMMRFPPLPTLLRSRVTSGGKIAGKYYKQ